MTQTNYPTMSIETLRRRLCQVKEAQPRGRPGYDPVRAAALLLSDIAGYLGVPVMLLRNQMTGQQAFSAKMQRDLSIFFARLDLGEIKKIAPDGGERYRLTDIRRYDGGQAAPAAPKFKLGFTLTPRGLRLTKAD